jgi:hypothetical protein
MMSSSIGGRVSALGHAATVGPPVTQDSGASTAPSSGPVQVSTRANTLEIPGRKGYDPEQHTETLSLLTGSPLPAARAATPPLTTSWAEDESEVPAREQQAWGGEEGYSHAEGLDEAEYLLAPGVGLPRTLFEDGRPRPHVEGEPNLTRLGTPGTTRFAFPPYPQCRSCRRNCVSGDDAPPCTIAPTRCRTTQPPRQPRSSIRLSCGTRRSL